MTSFISQFMPSVARHLRWHRDLLSYGGVGALAPEIPRRLRGSG